MSSSLCVCFFLTFSTIGVTQLVFGAHRLSDSSTHQVTLLLLIIIEKPVLKGPFVFRNILTVRNEVAKVMFLHVSVSHSVHGGGVLSQHALQVVSQHALQQGDACSRGCLLGRVWRTPPQKQTVADGTHPTGMHSCLKISWLVIKLV